MALEPFFRQLEREQTLPITGHVIEANGHYVESLGPPGCVGDCCEIVCSDGTRAPGEIIGFRQNHVLSMPLSSSRGMRFGDRVVALGRSASIRVDMSMLCRVLDANGAPLDGAGPVTGAQQPLDRTSPLPFEREIITRPLPTGVRAIDTMLTVGRGQRIGIFGGSGVGKSTLIGMMTRNTAADITVVGLVGERGREVREFIEDSLGEDGRARSTVIVSTSDQSPLMRLRAAMAATATAEFFASRGMHVLLVVDSLTRYAMAAREIGLAAGEPPASKGYPPSVVASLARLLERAGNFSTGSITGFYTVLMEGDDEQDPVVDAARSILDGHIVLSRELAGNGTYPPIDLLRSLSRLMASVASPEHQKAARRARQLLGAYARGEDLIRVGAYREGSDPDLDCAVRLRPAMIRLFEQGADETVRFEDAIATLCAMDEGAA